MDENGIIRIGATIKEGDILIGKITPKGESDPTPEEKLLRAIFGDKAGDAKDASLKAPNGTEGTVIDKKLFQRAVKDKNSKVREKAALEKTEKAYNLVVDALRERLNEKITTLLKDKTSAGVTNSYGEVLKTIAVRSQSGEFVSLEKLDDMVSDMIENSLDQVLSNKDIAAFTKYD